MQALILLLLLVAGCRTVDDDPNTAAVNAAIASNGMAGVLVGFAAGVVATLAVLATVRSVSTPLVRQEVFKWNPYNKCVKSIQSGAVHLEHTNRERRLRGLPVPWSPEMSRKEQDDPPLI